MALGLIYKNSLVTKTGCLQNRNTCTVSVVVQEIPSPAIENLVCNRAEG